MEGNVLEISPCSQLTQLHSRPQPPGRSPLRGGEDPPHPAVGLRSSGGMAGDDRRSPPGHGRPLPGLGGAAAARDGLREAAVRGPAARGACRASRCEALRRAGPPGESLICLPVLGMSKPLLFMIKKKQLNKHRTLLLKYFARAHHRGEWVVNHEQQLVQQPEAQLITHPQWYRVRPLPAPHVWVSVTACLPGHSRWRIPTKAPQSRTEVVLEGTTQPTLTAIPFHFPWASVHLFRFLPPSPRTAAAWKRLLKSS